MITLDDSDLALVHALPFSPKEAVFITASNGRLTISGENIQVTRTKPWVLPQPMGIWINAEDFKVCLDPTQYIFWKAWHTEPWGQSTNSAFNLAALTPKIKQLREVRTALAEAKSAGVPIELGNRRLKEILATYGDLLDAPDETRNEFTMERTPGNTVMLNGFTQSNTPRHAYQVGLLTRRLMPDMVLQCWELADVYAKHPKCLQISNGHPFLLKRREHDVQLRPLLDKSDVDTIPAITIMSYPLVTRDFAIELPIWLNRILADRKEWFNVAITVLDCGKNKWQSNKPHYALTRLRIDSDTEVMEIFVKLVVRHAGDMRPLPQSPETPREDPPEWVKDLLHKEYYDRIPQNIRDAKWLPSVFTSTDGVYLYSPDLPTRPGWNQCMSHPLVFFERKLRMDCDKDYIKASRATKEFFAMLITHQRWLSRQVKSTDPNVLIHTAYLIAIGNDCADDALPYSALTDALSHLTTRA